MDVKHIVLVAVLAVPACVADSGEEADALSATDGGAVSASATLGDGGTSQEMQAYAQLYEMVRAGCEPPGATAVRISVPWDNATTDVYCADVASKGERGIIGALIGLAVNVAAHFAEDWCEDHNRGRKGTKQDAHCHHTIPAWSAAVGFGLAFVL